MHLGQRQIHQIQWRCVQHHRQLEAQDRGQCRQPYHHKIIDHRINIQANNSNNNQWIQMHSNNDLRWYRMHNRPAISMKKGNYFFSFLFHSSNGFMSSQLTRKTNWTFGLCVLFTEIFKEIIQHHLHHISIRRRRKQPVQMRCHLKECHPMEVNRNNFHKATIQHDHNTLQTTDKVWTIHTYALCTIVHTMRTKTHIIFNCC